MWAVNPATAGELSADERRHEMEARWQKGGLSFYGVFADLLIDAEANNIATEFIRSKIRVEVHDPKLAAQLSPHSYMGCKRICLDTDYYATYNRPNVTLVDISDAPIEEITRTGLRTGGRDYALDTIVFAIGFDAMTGPLLRIDIRAGTGRRSGRSGPRAREPISVSRWRASPTCSPSPAPPALGAHQHGPHHRAACGVDIGLHRARAERGAPVHRSHARGGGPLDDPPRGSCGRDALPLLQLVVRRRQRPRQAAHGDALYRGMPAYREKCDAVVANGYEGFSLSTA